MSTLAAIYRLLLLLQLVSKSSAFVALGFQQPAFSSKPIKLTQWMTEKIRLDAKTTTRTTTILWQSSSILRADDPNEYWARQLALLQDIHQREETALVKEQKKKFAKRHTALMIDTIISSLLICSVLWVFSPNPFHCMSFAFGSLFGLAYTYGLGKYVATLGKSLNSSEDRQAAGWGMLDLHF